MKTQSLPESLKVQLRKASNITFKRGPRGGIREFYYMLPGPPIEHVFYSNQRGEFTQFFREVIAFLEEEGIYVPGFTTRGAPSDKLVRKDVHATQPSASWSQLDASLNAK